MTAQEWEAWCDATAEDDEPPGLGQEDEDWEESDPQAGEPVAGAAGFAQGGVLDGLPGGVSLAFHAEDAAGDDDRYAGASDNELDGAITAWDRIEAYAAARKHAAVARRSSGAARNPSASPGSRGGGMSSPLMSCGWCWPSRGPPRSG